MSVPQRYAIAVAIFFTSLLLRFWLLPLEGGIPYLTFYPATVATFYLCGTGPGLLVVATGAVTANYIFVAPYWAFNFDQESINAFFTFVISSSMFGLIFKQMRSYAELNRISAAAFETKESSIMITDANGAILRVNRAFAENTGYAIEEILGKTPRLLQSGYHNADFYREMWETIHRIGTWQGEIWDRRKNGEIYPKLLTITAVKRDDGTVTHYVGSHVDISERKITERQLRELSAHLQTVREEEKARIAREIHDELGGTLTALKMDVQLLADELSANKEALHLAEQAVTIADLLGNASVATRRIITDLRPAVLDDLGLLAALEWQAGQFRQRTGIQCWVTCRKIAGHTGETNRMQSIHLFRIFQESLTNIARHSGATRVEVDLQYEDQIVSLTIRDNGRGLPEGHDTHRTSYGMLGMRERVEQMKGRINFYNSPGHGLSVQVTLPLPVDVPNEEKA